jgi:hypothetical protein
MNQEKLQAANSENGTFQGCIKKKKSSFVVAIHGKALTTSCTQGSTKGVFKTRRLIRR